jgi:hypothetical protein
MVEDWQAQNNDTWDSNQEYPHAIARYTNWAELTTVYLLIYFYKTHPDTSDIHVEVNSDSTTVVEA